MKKKSIVGVCCLLFLITGCMTTGSGTLTFKELNYAGSMSPFHVDVNGIFLSENKGLKVISTFNIRKSFYSILYGGVDLSDEKELVTLMNKEIEAVKGDGIINVSILAENCGILKYPVISLLLVPLPFIPGCVNVQVQGEIVQLQ